MKTDNTIHLISRTKEFANCMIVLELEKLGVKGVVPSHGEIVVALSKYKELTMTEIAQEISKDRSTVTTLVNKLNHMGITATKKNEKDQRSNLVFLTSKGKELQKDIIKISEKLYEIQYKDIQEEEKIVFRKILTKIHNNFKNELE